MTTGDFITGLVTITQTSGDIHLNNLRGDLRAKTTSGMIDVDQKEGAIDISSHGGKIHIMTDLFADKEFHVENITGQVELIIPERAGAIIDISTMSGEIDTRGVPVEVESFTKRAIRGTIGSTGPKIFVRTESGDIRLGWR